MSMTLSSVAGKSFPLAQPVLPMLRRFAERLLVMALPKSERDARNEEIIAILLDPSTAAERRERAERCLCGMADHRG
jgi:hypothetical protein